MDLTKSTSPIRMSIIGCTVFLTACDSGSFAEVLPAKNQVHAQAIDGYIVNGSVMCDGNDGGRTAAGGWLVCPAGTTLITVSGGRDVGLDETATTGGSVFKGSLQAPGDARYVTPLTTLAAKLAETNGVFNRAAYDNAVTLITNRLDLQTLDLASNPATNVELASLNAELNLIATQFSSNVDDYSTAMQAISNVFKNNNKIDLTDGVSLASAINQQLISISPHQSVNPANEITAGNNLNSKLAKIESAETIDELNNSINQVTIESVFSLDKNSPLISIQSSHYYQNYWNYSSYYQTSNEIFTLTEFSNSVNSGSDYQMRIEERDTDRLIFNSDAFQIGQTLQNTPIDVALEFESQLDIRHMSVIVKGVLLSMDKGNSRSIRMELPHGAMLNAQYTDQHGVITQITETAEEDLFASAENGSFSISLGDIRTQLSNYGYPNFLRQDGHFKMSLVLEGLNFDLIGNGVISTPETYTVSTGTSTVSGYGIQGYFSIY